MTEAGGICLHCLIQHAIEQFRDDWRHDDDSVFTAVIEAFAQNLVEMTAGCDKAERRQISIELMKAIVRHENELKEAA